MKKQDNMKILLVCDNRADVVNIRAKVDSHENIACYVWQCPTLSEGIGYLNIKKLRADMIILDLGLSGEDTPEEIYRQMGVAAQDIPIIVITGKGNEEHDLAAFVMESGAADNMIRGEFGGLTDAMDFALIRSKITKEKESEADKALQDSKNDCDEKSQKDQQDHQDHLSMFMGGYSVTNNDAKDKKA
ncbi:MAG: hypothetical protein PHX61_02845 [Alphaproteobacteria bacterium]|nr:hypothetical protein [Alphaproteobacteria bacterium]